MSTKEWLDKLRHIGTKLSVPDQRAKQAFSRQLLAQATSELKADICVAIQGRASGAAAKYAAVDQALAAAKVRGLVHEWQFAEQWHRSAYAQVIAQPRLFASLAETRIPRELVPEVGFPWDCFVVRIPEEFGAAPIYFSPEHAAPPTYLACYRTEAGGAALHNGALVGDRVVEIKPESANGASVLFRFSSLGELLDPNLDSGTGVRAWDGRSMSPENLNLETVAQSLSARRATLHSVALLRRAFVGVVMELNNQLESAQYAANRSATKATRGERQSSTVVLGRPVVLDCRARVGALLRGTRPPKRSASEFQVFVRGHWKRQPCGLGSFDRKFIHVEPYWRGPEDAPIYVRPHMLKGGAPPQAAE